MASTKTADESSKRDIANNVITPKRKYFIPSLNAYNIDADGPVEAVEQVTATKKSEEEGDA